MLFTFELSIHFYSSLQLDSPLRRGRIQLSACIFSQYAFWAFAQIKKPDGITDVKVSGGWVDGDSK